MIVTSVLCSGTPMLVSAPRKRQLLHSGAGGGYRQDERRGNGTGAGTTKTTIILIIARQRRGPASRRNPGDPENNL